MLVVVVVVVVIFIIIFSAQGISDTEGEEKIVRKCKRWNDHYYYYYYTAR